MIYLCLALRYKTVLIIPFVPMRSAKKQIICVKYCFSYTAVQSRRWFYDLSDTLKTDRSGRTTSLHSFILACDPLTFELSSIILFYCCRLLSKPEQKILHFHNSLRLAGWLRVIIPDFKGIPTNLLDFLSGVCLTIRTKKPITEKNTEKNTLGEGVAISYGTGLTGCHPHCLDHGLELDAAIVWLSIPVRCAALHTLGGV